MTTQPHEGQMGHRATHSLTRRWLQSLPALIGWILSLLMLHYPMLLSGLSRTQREPCDGQLNHYILEHSWRWLIRAPAHLSLFDPPFFYPQPNVLAHTDVLLSFAPLYWPWRMIGFQADTAFQLWMLAVATANYAVFHWFLKRWLGISPLAAAAGAVLFTAAGIRAAQFSHEQLYCQIYVVLALAAICKFCAIGAQPARGIRENTPSEGGSSNKARFGLLLLALCVAAQFWGGFYLGYFLVLAIITAFIWMLILPTQRSKFLALLRLRWLTVILAISATALLLAPLALHYLHVYRLGVSPDDALISTMIPRPITWLYMGDDSLMYGWMTKIPVVAALPMRQEHAAGVGVITTLAAAIGLWLNRRRPGFQVLILSTVTLLLLTTAWFGNVSFWWVIHHLLPGAKAIRAVARVGVFLLIPASIGLAALVDALRARRQTLAAIILVLVCLAEQVHHLPSWDKLAERREHQTIAAAVPADATAFFLTSNAPAPACYQQTAAMWVSVERGIPTLNGYSGVFPPHWRLLENKPATMNDLYTLRSSLRDWIERHHLDANKIAWMNADYSAGNPAAPRMNAYEINYFAACPLNAFIPLYLPASQQFLGANWLAPTDLSPWLDMSDPALRIGSGGVLRCPSGPSAEMRLALPPLHQAALVVRMLPLGQSLQHRPIRVEFAGKVLGEWQIATNRLASYSLPLPESDTATHATIRLLIPQAEGNSASPGQFVSPPVAFESFQIIAPSAR